MEWEAAIREGAVTRRNMVDGVEHHVILSLLFKSPYFLNGHKRQNKETVQ